MTKKKLMFDTRQVGGNIATEKALWQGFPLPPRTVDAEELAAVVGRDSRLDPLDVQYVWDKTGVTVKTMVGEGYNVDLDWVAFEIVLLGSFESLDAPFDQSKNRLVVRAHVRPPVRDCVAAITPANVNPALTAKIHSVMDSAAQAEGLITVASKVLVSGSGIRIVQSRADEGVALCARSGEVVATPTILANDAATLDLAFDELPPDGDYTLVVKTRNGESTDRGLAVASRNISIAHANA